MSEETKEPTVVEPKETTAEPMKPTFIDSIRPQGLPFFIFASLFLVLALVQTIRLGSQRNQFNDHIATMQKDHASEIDSVNNAATQSLAGTLGSSLHQLFVMRSQFPEITNRTFQAVASEMAETGDYKLVVIADSSGTVLASSDLTMVGRAMSEINNDDASLSASSQIKEMDATLGSVYIEVLPSALGAKAE